MANSRSDDGDLPVLLTIDTDPGADFYTYPVELKPGEEANIRIRAEDTPNGTIRLKEDYWDYSAKDWADDYQDVNTWDSASDEKIFVTPEKTRIIIGMDNGDYTSGTFNCRIGVNATYPQIT